jgi:hypothetical protein
MEERISTECKLAFDFIGEKLLTNCRLSALRAEELLGATND